jgi:hypothetical protein
VIVTFYDSKGAAAAKADQRGNRSGTGAGVTQQRLGQGLELHPDALEPPYPVSALCRF